VIRLNALERIRRAAKGGDLFAQFEIAVSLDYADDGRRDFGRASDWYAKAARQGHRAANNNLLLQHVLGQAKLRRPKAVFSELTALAESGDRDAENNLGLCHQFGYGTTADYRKAATWFRRAARSGSAEAQFNLGGYYFEGKGRRKDLHRTLEWYTRSAHQGHGCGGTNLVSSHGLFLPGQDGKER
jgi:TPR repeat protein